MIYRQLLTTTYQSEHYTNYNKNRASFTFAVKDALITVFFILISDNIEVVNFNFLSTKGDIHNE